MDAVETKVIEIIKEKAGMQEKEISPAAHFSNDPGLDSFDAFELTLDLEKVFEITIPDEEAEHIQTVRQAIDTVKDKLKNE